MNELRIEVHKFGGTSLGDAERIGAAAGLVGEAARSARIVVVASAMAGGTDVLAAAASTAARGQRQEALDRLEGLAQRHSRVLEALGGDAEARGDLGALIAEAGDLLRALAVLCELRPRVLDRILATGEKMAARLLAVALRRLGVSARAFDADAFLATNDRFGDARPLAGVARRLAQAALLPHLDRGESPVVTGFVGQAPDGATTTLGRGGSDYTATFLGAALGAARVVIWTDVDGVFSADPSVVPESRRVEQLNYREAAELSYYGAKVLQPRTLREVAVLGIPVEIRNSLRSGAAGTVVDGRFTPGSHPVKAVSAIRGQALLSLEGSPGVPETSARALSVLAEEEIAVTLISQASSEASICLAVPASDLSRAEVALKREFRLDLGHGGVGEIAVSGGIGLVAVVGLGMAHVPGVAARVTGALAGQAISIAAIAQGSSELNISLAVADEEVDRAVCAIHREFRLDRADTGEEAEGRMDLLLLGCGRVGRAVVAAVLERASFLETRFGIRPRWAALSDSSGFLFNPQGLSPEVVRAACRAKADGRPLADLPGGVAGEPAAMLEQALAYRLARPVLMDTSDCDAEAVAAYRTALRLGCDVVTANKKPLAGPSYAALIEQARSGHRLLRSEATVGAGLPVIETLAMLLSSGDTVHRIEGCLSGTLAFVLAGLERGLALSEVVEEAVERGFAEPDPVADLSGADMARKALILGRIAGLLEAPHEIEVEGLVDSSLAGLEPEELARELARYDQPLRRRVAEARRVRRRLCYVAEIEPGRARVGLQEVAVDSPLGRLSEGESAVVFRTDRYRDPPLTVSGPGAGVEVTAMGVFADLMYLVAERR
jgi:aspartokinase/homoserine dehydrogenase 1